MNLNNIQLGAHLLTELYPNVLVEGDKASAVPEKTMLKHLGNNARGIAILVNNKEAAFLTDAELQFLTNILTACKLNLADVAVVNSAGASSGAVQEKIDDLKATVVLLTGVSPLEIDLPINFPAFQVQHFNNRTYLYSPALSEVESDKTLKMKLWNCLKTIFLS